jgi:hypothetical protein
MCPVRAAAELVSQLYKSSIPHSKVPDLKINTIILSGRIFTIPSTRLLDKIRSAVRSLGKVKLGFTEEEVGTHSYRSGGTMGMYLAGTPVYTTMPLGCWSSDPFMRYIQKQVLNMSPSVSSKMITYEEFYTIPDFIHNAAGGDIRTRNNTSLATTTSFSGSHTNM